MPWSPPVAPATQSPLSPAEMDLLVARTGLTLNPGQMADLVLAWRQVAGLIASIPRSDMLVDDQAFVFRLPGPTASTPAPKAPTKSRPETASKPGVKPAAKAPAAKPEKAPKTRMIVKQPTARKPVPKTPSSRKAAKPAPGKPARKR
jgi:hypothetical protein